MNMCVYQRTFTTEPSKKKKRKHHWIRLEVFEVKAESTCQQR